MRKIGYARVSSIEQNLALQLDALKVYGCELIFSDKISGRVKERKGLEKCLSELLPGDSLVVWRLDRLGRSMTHLVSVVSDLKDKGIGFKSICDGAIDTTTASGELIFNIFASLAQFERDLIRERTMAGIKVARSRGKYGGRRQVTSKEPKVIAAKKLYKDQTLPIESICEMMGVSKTTLYRWLSL